MSDNRKKLLEQFSAKNQFSTFGPCIKKMTINGFRGIKDLDLNFEYPITAISGTNGSGKSTIGQLAVCSYSQPNKIASYKRKYVKEFFPVSVLDPTPFEKDANVKFYYASINQQSQELTVSRSTKSNWSGYKRQPPRHAFYIGFTLYIPKVERRDLSVYRSGSFTVGEKRIISGAIKAHVSNILNNKYDEVAFQKISHNQKMIELGLVTKLGYSYSENNMGFGEGRLMYMIDMLENKPDRSLFILEEPETSLHEDAQYKFVNYLMDVCVRKHHQVILSTHSSVILDALPPEGTKFLHRDFNGVTVLDRVSGSRAKSILTDGHTKALTICVEDSFAELLLIEAIRKLKPQLLPSILIKYVGDTKAVAESVKFLRSLSINAIGVRDADTGENIIDKLFKLPGGLPPEKEVYDNVAVQNRLDTKYFISVTTIFSTYQELDHHKYGKILSQKAYCTEEAINLSAIEAYFDVVGIDSFDSLIDTIEREI